MHGAGTGAFRGQKHLLTALGFEPTPDDDYQTRIMTNTTMATKRNGMKHMADPSPASVLVPRESGLASRHLCPDSSYTCRLHWL